YSYTKEHLLELYQAASQTPGWPAAAVADFFLADWNPRVPSAAVAGEAGATAGAGTDDAGPWSKDKDKDDTTGLDGRKGVRGVIPKIGPEVCWDHAGGLQPLTMKEMTASEREAVHL
ncbi:hypothetical protein KEM52_004306, partial [Ascosphaera acerosa]